MDVRPSPANYEHREGSDDYCRAGGLFRMMRAAEQGRRVANIAGAMRDVPRFIPVRQIAHCLKADQAYAAGIAAGPGIDLSAVDRAA